MKNIKKISLLFVTIIILFSFSRINKYFNNNIVSTCNESFMINNLNLNLCNNEIKLTSSDLLNGIGNSIFTKTFEEIEEDSFEDTDGKAYFYEFSENQNTDKTITFIIFEYPNNKYYYSFSIDSDNVSITYNSGTEFKIGDSMDKIASEFSSKGFEYDPQKKLATINIIDEGYITFYFDDSQNLKSISFNYNLI